MRTTVTLDPDVERLIRNAMRDRGISFKEALNQAARKGLLRDKPAASRKFVQKAFRMGTMPDLRWDKALATAAALDDEDLKRKIASRR